jgi:hypothetical protein
MAIGVDFDRAALTHPFRGGRLARQNIFSLTNQQDTIARYCEQRIVLEAAGAV